MRKRDCNSNMKRKGGRKEGGKSGGSIGLILFEEKPILSANRSNSCAKVTLIPADQMLLYRTLSSVCSSVDQSLM